MAEHEQPPHQGNPGEPGHGEPPKLEQYEIIVNGRPEKVDGDYVTYEQVVAFAKNLPPPGKDVEYTVTFKDAVEPQEGDLIPGERVKIKNGTQFVVTATNRS